MKAFFAGVLLLVSPMAFAASTSSQQVNQKIQSCIRETAAFFRNVPLDNGYYTGKNKNGKCFISFVTRADLSGMITFMNTAGTKYVASLEVSINEEPNPTGITNDIKQCAVNKTSLSIRNTYRMPRYLYYRNDGAIARSWSLFDVVDNQSMQLTKDANGKLVSAVYQTKNGGQQTCYFE